MVRHYYDTCFTYAYPDSQQEEPQRPIITLRLFNTSARVSFSAPHDRYPSSFNCFPPNGAKVSNKPGVCVKVLSLKPRHCLEEELAQLADAALPAELVVR